jgi:hypothetical protein
MRRLAFLPQVRSRGFKDANRHAPADCRKSCRQVVDRINDALIRAVVAHGFHQFFACRTSGFDDIGLPRIGMADGDRSPCKSSVKPVGASKSMFARTVLVVRHRPPIPLMCTGLRFRAARPFYARSSQSIALRFWLVNWPEDLRLQDCARVGAQKKACASAG